MNQQHPSEILVEDPHLCGKRLRRPLADGRQPLAGPVEFRSRQPDISGRGLYHPVLKRFTNHWDNIRRRSDTGMAPDDVPDALRDAPLRAPTIRTGGRLARLLRELIPKAIVQERAYGLKFTTDCLVDRDGRASVFCAAGTW